MQNGYCTAAIRTYQEFLIQDAYESDLLERDEGKPLIFPYRFPPNKQFLAYHHDKTFVA